MSIFKEQPALVFLQSFCISSTNQDLTNPLACSHLGVKVQVGREKKNKKAMMALKSLTCILAPGAGPV
jgi:hypothetical protein